MATRNPFDYSDMFKMFDPEEVARAFDPARMMAAFQPKPQGPDFNGVFEQNRKAFEAMVDANKAAASAYKDLMEKQMEVFHQLTAAARDHAAWVDEAAGPEAITKKSEAYGVAVEKALGLMRKLADSARDANEEAFSAMKGQMTEAMDEVKRAADAKTT